MNVGGWRLKLNPGVGRVIIYSVGKHIMNCICLARFFSGHQWVCVYVCVLWYVCGVCVCACTYVCV